MEYELEYNSASELLRIPEYGRHVQNLIYYCKTIEDAEKQQTFAEQVVGLMHQMNPQNKNVLEYKNRLWKHFFFIANYEIDVKAPEGLVIEPDTKEKTPLNVEYPKFDSKFRHYGHNIKSLIEKAIAMEEGPVKEGFVDTIAGFMKMAYKNWNREHYVSDEIVLEDLKVLSNGQLEVSENASLDTLAKAVRHTKRRPSNDRNNNKRGRSNNNRGRNNNNRRRGGRR